MEPYKFVLLSYKEYHLEWVTWIGGCYDLKPALLQTSTHTPTHTWHVFKNTSHVFKNTSFECVTVTLEFTFDLDQVIGIRPLTQSFESQYMTWIDKHTHTHTHTS